MPNPMMRLRVAAFHRDVGDVRLFIQPGHDPREFRPTLQGHLEILAEEVCSPVIPPIQPTYRVGFGLEKDKSVGNTPNIRGVGNAARNISEADGLPVRWGGFRI